MRHEKIFNASGLANMQRELDEARGVYGETSTQMTVGGVLFGLFCLVAPEIGVPLTFVGIGTGIIGQIQSEVASTLSTAIDKVGTYRMMLASGNYTAVRMELETASVRSSNGTLYYYPTEFRVTGVLTKSGSWMYAE